MLKVYNTLTRKKETFKPIKNKEVGMYSCGPTVYNYAHIGNLRTYTFNDILKRSLTFLGYKVNHVMNITDVDDKTIRASQQNNSSLKEFTRKYENILFQDLEEMNILKPNYVLRATESIPEMIEMINTLLEKKYAYKTSDGIYFSIDKSKKYGKLANLDKITKTKERIKKDEYDKENTQDFALWKFHSSEDGDNFWEAPFGKGRPGWHIECSAMSTKILGPSFDIHTGGIDLIFPHHTNEIAQSEAATGEHFVKYWMHGGFLTIKDAKMSKSLGNFLFIKDLKEKGFSPLDFRYFCLTTHYRDPLIFSVDNLQAAKNSYQRLKNIIQELEDDGKTNKSYLTDFKRAIENDLDIPQALQILWKLARDTEAEGKVKTLKIIDEIFGLKLFERDKLEIPSEIKKLLDERESARKGKDWKKSDTIRDKIKSLGYVVQDTPEGQKLNKN